MSEKYKVRDQDRPYFITFAVEKWIDVFTCQQYKDIIIPISRGSYFRAPLKNVLDAML